MVDIDSNGWIETYTGRKFFVDDGCFSEIVVEDIAHALSLMVRYNGHIKSNYLMYTVAEHTCHLTDFVLAGGASPVEALTMLHHEDAEAYIGDLARPIKQLLPEFRNLEAKIMKRAAARFGLINPEPDWLKEYDARILVDERRQIMNPSGHEWPTDHLDPLGITVEFWEPPRAKREFLTRHDKLMGSCLWKR